MHAAATSRGSDLGSQACEARALLTEVSPWPHCFALTSNHLACPFRATPLHSESRCKAGPKFQLITYTFYFNDKLFSNAFNPLKQNAIKNWDRWSVELAGSPSRKVFWI